MSTFIGNIAAKFDVKGRMFLPSQYRKLLPAESQGQVVMRLDVDRDCIILYPEPVWNAKVEQLKSQLDEWDAEDQMILMQFVSDAEWLDIDSQGRILLSKRYQQAIGLENSEVLFVGMVDRIAIWNPKTYQGSRLSSSDLAKKLSEKMKKSTI